MPRSASPPPGIAARTVVLLLAGVAVVVTVGGVLTYRDYERRVRAELGGELSAIAELKVGELVQWRSERDADARFFAENRTFAAMATRVFVSGDQAAADEIRQWFDKMRATDRYEGIALLDASGVARLVHPHDGDLARTHSEQAHESHASGQPTWLDFHRDSPDDAIHLSLTSPITNDDGSPLGAVLLRIDPTVYLYPFLGRWPVPARTAETFLVRREGDEAVYLNPLRFDPAGALQRRLPLSRRDVPAVRGVLGEQGVFEGVDYAHQPVVAAVRQVPGAPWVLVARIDPSEAWAPVRDRLRQTILIGLLIVLAAGGGLAAFWQRSSARAKRQIEVLNDELRAQHAAGARSLNQLRGLVQASPTILYTLAMTDPADPATWVSDNITRILGYTVDDALAPGWWEAHLHPDDRDRAIEQSRGIAHQSHLVQEYRFLDAGGQYRVIRDEMRLSRGTVDHPIEVVGAWTDMTAQREAEDQQRLQLSVLQAAANAIVISSAEGRIEWANPAFTALTGYTLDEARGRTPGELLKSGRHDEVFYRDMWATVTGGGVWRAASRTISTTCSPSSTATPSSRSRTSPTTTRSATPSSRSTRPANAPRDSRASSSPSAASRSCSRTSST